MTWTRNSLPKPRMDGRGGYARKVESTLLRMLGDYREAAIWKNAICKMAWGYKYPFGRMGWNDVDVPRALLPLVAWDNRGWRLSDEGWKWLVEVGKA